jgi:two-component system sensor histidine kinase UhpB
VSDSARTIADTSQRVYDVVRNMMRRLRPVILDELGLVPALQTVIDDWNEGHEEAFCRFRSDGDLSTLNDEIKINVYRIVQEALTNVTKHARATAVDIEIRRRIGPSGADELLLHIADDGAGMDTEKRSWGLGLLGMRERCEALNGSFTLQSRPGEGLEIDVCLPLNQAATIGTNDDERHGRAG